MRWARFNASLGLLTVLALAALVDCSAPAPPLTTGGPLGYGLPDARGVVFFQDQMGSSFKLVRLELLLSGEPLLTCDEGERLLDASQPLRVYDGPLSSGRHELDASLRFRGHGYGIFSYLKGYHFDVRGRETIEAASGGEVAIEVIAYERGDATSAIEDRPQVRFVVKNDGVLPPGPTEGCPWAAPDQLDDAQSRAVTPASRDAR